MPIKPLKPSPTDLELFKSFCGTQDVNKLVLGGLSFQGKIRKIIMKIERKEYTSDKINKNIYWILRSYVDRATLDIVPLETLDHLCKYLSERNYDEEEKLHLFYTLYNKINVTGELQPSLSNLTESHLEKLFYYTDELYFFKYFTNHVINGDITISFKLTTDSNTKVAAYCDKRRYGPKCHYTISINTEIITASFKKYNFQRSNGLVCDNPLACFMSTFLHEMIHFILMSRCPEHNIGNGGHTAMFRKISYALFGHTEFVAEYGRESLKIRHTAATLKVGDKVSYKASNNIRYFGYIIKVNIKTVKVGHDEKGMENDVPMNLIEKEEPSSTGEPRIAKPAVMKPSSEEPIYAKGDSVYCSKTKTGITFTATVIQTNKKSISVTRDSTGERMAIPFNLIKKVGPAKNEE